MNRGLTTDGRVVVRHSLDDSEGELENEDLDDEMEWYLMDRSGATDEHNAEGLANRLSNTNR